MWKNGKKCAIMLGFDFDAESLWVGSMGLSTPTYLSRGAYGARVGVPRILDLLDKYGLKATFFIPGDTCERHPDEVKEIHARGHEIGHHGHVHESPLKLERDEEKKVLEKGFELLDKTVGVKPSGYRSPAWDLSPNSIGLFKEFGFLYDSSMMGDDFRPYKIIEGGQDTGIVELPVTWILDDAPHFLSNVFPYIVGLADPDKVYKIWATEFDGAYAQGGAFILTCHPQIIGRYHRITMLERLIEYMLGHPDVWFTTGTELAQEWLAQQK